MAMVHPKGRMLQYGPRVEVQSEDFTSVKNAKIFPRGISSTANNMALVYLLDEAGARTTTDMFHDLYATEIADTLFEESCRKEGEVLFTCMEQLDMARYWRTEAGVTAGSSSRFSFSRRRMAWSLWRGRCRATSLSSRPARPTGRPRLTLASCR